jgi:hypothetical protein
MSEIKRIVSVVVLGNDKNQISNSHEINYDNFERIVYVCVFWSLNDYRK